MSHSIKLFVFKKNIREHGKAMINICVTINGKRKYFPTDLKATAENYDFDKNIFIAPKGEVERNNALLRKQFNEFDQAIFYLLQRNIPLSFENIQNRLKGSELIEFADYAKKMLFETRKQIAFKTYQQNDYCINMVANYAPDLGLSEINTKWLSRFKAYMELKGLKPNSVATVFRIVRKYVKMAIADGIIQDNPFQSFSVGNSKKADIQYLDEKELLAFESLLSANLESKLQNTLIHFLHSCYTGLRAVDQRRFNPDEHLENDFIVMQMQKTGLQVRVPINEKAKALQAMFNQKLKQSHSRIADDLKEICAKAGINKHITFNCSRHTFAIHSLIKGVPLEVVSKWLGHTSVTMTQNYAKVVDSLSHKEMKKWNMEENEFLKITIVGKNGKYQANVFLEGKEFDFPLEEESPTLLKSKLMMKLADWFN